MTLLFDLTTPTTTCIINRHQTADPHLAPLYIRILKNEIYLDLLIHILIGQNEKGVCYFRMCKISPSRQITSSDVI